ncbi:MAG: hypothetical protein EBT59_11160 [Betaproteobacteria bacterium]|nr:hypothetical protein [Betaproteobacteria bacterium]
MLCRTGYAEPASRDAALKNHPHATIGIFWAQAVSTPMGASIRVGAGLARFGGDGFCFIMKSDKKNIMNCEILDFFGS